ncbi:hypothetical protein ACW73L_02710 [Methylolobus aquaticus]
MRLVRYILNIPLILPGFMGFMDRAGWVAVLIFAILAASRGGSFKVLAVAVTLAEALFGLVIGMRTDTLTPLVFLVLGLYVGSNSAKWLLIGSVIVTFAAISVTPVVKQVRALTWNAEYQSGRAGAVSDAFQRQLREDSLDEPAGYAFWRRLDYTPWEAAMMRSYDRGDSGDTFRYIFWTFAPRFLFPEKPNFVIGTDIGLAIQGVDQSSSFSGTAFGEMYWNGGWLAVVLASATFGVLLGMVTIGTLWLFLRGTLVSSLIGVTGLLYAFAIAATFSVAIVGQAVTFFVLFSAFFKLDAYSTQRVRLAAGGRRIWGQE